MGKLEANSIRMPCQLTWPLSTWTLCAVHLTDCEGSCTAFTSTFSPTKGALPTTTLQKQKVQREHATISQSNLYCKAFRDWLRPHCKAYIPVYGPMAVLELRHNPSEDSLPHLRRQSFINNFHLVTQVTSWMSGGRSNSRLDLWCHLDVLSYIWDQLWNVFQDHNNTPSITLT